MAAPALEDRSCVILATNDYSSHTYTLHHIDVAPFFSHPDPDDEAMDGIPLPPASARFDKPPFPRNCFVNFHLLRGGGIYGGGDVKVVSTDGERRTVIYDVKSRAVRGGPVMRARKGSPISASVGDGLFVLELVPDKGKGCFEALRYDRLREDWFWHSLPRPPYVREPGSTCSAVAAHTAAAGGRIWTYTKNAGTYSFDTRRCSWRKEGDWALPFVGKAEHVPVCGRDGLSFGFASISGPLCAVDLATATAESPPEVRGVWEEFRLPGDWLGGTSSLVHLGSGKMCIFRFFGTVPSPPIDRSGKKPDRFVVITPVEVGPGDDNDKEIKMVKHRSKRIKLDRFNGHITWVL
ncbi:hypothetical protein CFC21_091432 [Triticum aestivum]|uniref:DUF1618 domain-containing protein n=2 Tax=Triticum aestivum TaxID=4565 RepID=A0A9R1LGA5_WHEAT|nr:hypothetical protein CFC21_091432 [Triticum aestivum]